MIWSATKPGPSGPDYLRSVVANGGSSSQSVTRGR